MLSKLKNKIHYFLDVIKNTKLIPVIDEIVINHKDECNVKYYVNNHYEKFEMKIDEFESNYIGVLTTDDIIRLKVSKRLYIVYLSINDETSKEYIWRCIDD